MTCKNAYSTVLGVKGSRVQIPPSRRFFEHLEAQLGTKWERSWLAVSVRGQQGPPGRRPASAA